MLTDDPDVRALWDTGDGEEEAAWRDRMESALERAGYRVEWYD
jgi:hypothetical protein